MFKKLRKNEKGFTLAELLIVVAIIGVLVAISIPIFTSQLEKAREATDAANIRSAYAEVVAEALTDDSKDVEATVKLVQSQDGWQNSNNANIATGNVSTSISAVNGATISGAPKKGGTAVVKYTHVDNGAGTVTITFSGN